MGSYMIWDITFKDIISKKSFKARMDNKCIRAKEIHNHHVPDEDFSFSNYYYDMGYLGYAEGREMKDELRKIGVIELKEICLCDIDGEIIMNNQRKKDKDDGSNDTLSGTPKQLQGKNKKDEHMLASVDNHVDTDNLTKTSNEASRIDGCRINPQDDSGAVTSAAKEDTSEGTFPGDSKFKKGYGRSYGSRRLR